MSVKTKALIRLRVIARKYELDKAVLFGILSKSWAVLTGPVTAILISLYFTPALQGYYYTFSTLIAFQVFVELGLGTVTQQFASHEWANLSLVGGKIVGNKDSLSRLTSIAQISAKWFMYGACIAAFGLAIGGYLFFSHSTDQTISWHLPWFLLSFATGINILLVPCWSLLEGCNQVKSIYAFRFWLGIISSVTVWISLSMNTGLWTSVIGSIVSIIFSLIFINKRYRYFFKQLICTHPLGDQINWRANMLPMQWRIAISWICGYISFSLFTPLLFTYHGPVVAGQMGMTWSLISVISAIGGSWLAPRVPQFAMLAAEGNYKALDRLFWKVTKVIIMVSTLVGVGIFAFVLLVNYSDVPWIKRFSTRVFSPLTIAIFLVGQILLSSSYPFSSYMRAHKQEPAMKLSIIASIMMGTSMIILGKYYAGLGVAIGYLATHIIIIPFIFMTWYKKRKAWMSSSAFHV